MQVDSRESIANLFRSLERVLRLEVELLRTQWTEDLVVQKNNTLLLLIASVLILFGFVLLTIGLVSLLKATTELPSWACELLVATPFLGLGLWIFFRRDKWRVLLTPSQTN
jgi:hypothetical protein